MQELKKYCGELSIELTDRQQEQFQVYYDLLIEWNEKVNLTAITEYDDVLKKHFLDSLALVKGSEIDLIHKVCVEGQKVKLLDIGTGAGFPAIPLKIVYPQLSVVMLDSLNKRINFLNEVIQRLELSDITALHGRAEDYAKKDITARHGRVEDYAKKVAENHTKKSDGTAGISDAICYREGFDIVVSRAVANLSTLSEYCLPYVREGGIFVAYKSEELAREQKEAEHAVGILGGKIEKIFDFILPCTDYHRNLCVIRKVKPTPKKYPRKAGTPAKEPLN